MNNKTSPFKHIKNLFKTNSSITGMGPLSRLKYIKLHHPELIIRKIKTGTKLFDWRIPEEWNIKDAYISDLAGNRIIDFKKNNLHVVNYSRPINKVIRRETLNKHLHSIKDLPDAIPYVTSYYKKQWGFCLSERERLKLNNEKYKVCIDSEFKSGHLYYGELLIPGKCKKEIVISTYICHPSMANNELSGPAVSIELAKYLKMKENNYTYRFIFIPETIGSIAYIYKNLDNIKKRTKFAINITCVGDKGEFSLMPTKYGDTLLDKILKIFLKENNIKYKLHSFLDRGSDERQFQSVGVDIPMVSLMRTKYGEYKEYHTSMDDIKFISSQKLNQTLSVYKKLVKYIDNYVTYKAVYKCEPQLSKRNLYSSYGSRFVNINSKNLLNFLMYADGNNTIEEISNHIKLPHAEVIKIRDTLLNNKLVCEI